MESQPQNPEFRIDPENFPPCMSMLLQTTKLLKSRSRLKVDCNCKVVDQN